MKPVFFTLLIRHAALLLVLGIFSLPVLAESETEPVPETINTEARSQVKTWLELQSSGEAASAQAQPLSGPVMDRVQERYLKSFSHPVPPYFEHVKPIDN